VNTYEIWVARGGSFLKRAATVKAETEAEAMRLARSSGRIPESVQHVSIRKVHDDLDQREQAEITLKL
jgi:hypothetical protein